MTSPTDSLLSPGTMLAHYRIGLPVGEGAMGTVYEAHDTGLDRRVAVKVLKPEIAETEDVVLRFEREARAAAKVNHPNLTHIYFVGSEGEKHYFAMEFLPGRTLDDHVAVEGRMELDLAIDTLVQTARGLAAAHQADVIHRDVKPSNIQILADGAVKVTDFGLAKSLSGEVDVTGGGKVLGTPRFMSPEQLRGEKLDWRTDLYALGLLGWFLLAGKHPYAGETLGKIIDDQINRPLPPLTDERPDLTPAVQRVLARFCAKKREERPESMEEAIRLLESLRPGYVDLAPIATRGAAFLLDLLIWFALSVTLYVSVVYAFLDGNMDVEWPFDLFGLAVLLLTQLGMEARFGASIGKLIFHLRVVARGRARPTWPKLLARLLIRLPVAATMALPPALEVLDFVSGVLTLLTMVAGVVCYFVARRKTLSDLLTGTRVVIRTREAHREKVA